MSLCRPVIVLGAERSGTSVCAEMVHAWGAYAGDPGELAAPDELNPRGRWEYLPLWELLAEIGGFAAGASWWAEDFPAQVAAKAAEPRLAGRARGLVAGMAARGRPWLWKDPALCHFLGFWRPFWRAPVFVVMVRHPVDIAVSWNQFRVAGGRAQTSLECNLLRWQHMMLSVLRTPRRRTSHAVRRVRGGDRRPAGPGAAARRIPRPAVRHRQRRGNRCGAWPGSASLACGATAAGSARRS